MLPGHRLPLHVATAPSLISPLRRNLTAMTARLGRTALMVFKLLVLQVAGVQLAHRPVLCAQWVSTALVVALKPLHVLMALLLLPLDPRLPSIVHPAVQVMLAWRELGFNVLLERTRQLDRVFVSHALQDPIVSLARPPQHRVMTDIAQLKVQRLHYPVTAALLGVTAHQERSPCVKQALTNPQQENRHASHASKVTSVDKVLPVSQPAPMDCEFTIVF